MELAINIKNTREQHWVKIEDILYIQSEGNDCHFVTTKEEFKFRITLKKAMASLMNMVISVSIIVRKLIKATLSTSIM